MSSNETVRFAQKQAAIESDGAEQASIEGKGLKPILALKKSDLKRFWAKVQKTETCWIWRASKFRDGYGQFSLGDKNLKAHRLSWAIHHCVFPAGICVLHRCDNRTCVNPDHLFLGTPKDNADDMIKKGRAVKSLGEDHGGAKLSSKDVRDIRKKYSSGILKQKDLAVEYHISKSVICNIVNRKTWTHI